MNRFLIPLLILLGSFLFSWHWNCNRKPNCPGQEQASVEQVMAPAVTADTTTTIAKDTTQKAMPEEEQVLFEPLNVYFESGKSSLNRSEEVTNWLATAKKYLDKNPSAKLSVVGNTDSDGTDESNVSLSARRAELVKGILVKDGFSAEKLETSGKGEANPIADNATDEGKAKNRRVSISLIK